MYTANPNLVLKMYTANPNRHERDHVPEKYALNMTAQRLVERADKHNAVYRAKLRAEHDTAMLVRSPEKSQEFVMFVVCA